MSRVRVMLAAVLVALGAPIVSPRSLAHAQSALPTPRGYVNDFAGVLDAAAEKQIDSLAQRVRAVARGEMVTVTLPDLGGRPVEEVALRLGREWKVGANAAIGDAARNAGVIILIVPKESSTDGKGHCRIEVGQGAEGFITDYMAGRICRDQVPLFRTQNYAKASLQIADEVAALYAAGFGVDLEGDSLSTADVAGLKSAAEGEKESAGDVLLLVFGGFALIGLFVGGIFLYFWFSARQERHAAEMEEIVAAAVAGGGRSKKKKRFTAGSAVGSSSRSSVSTTSSGSSGGSSWFTSSSGSSGSSSSSSAFGGGGGFSGGGGGSDW